MKRTVIILLTGSFLSLSCGAIFKGSSQDVSVQSSPPASLKVSGREMVYSTPTNLKLERNKNYVLTFSKEGYESASIEVTKSLSGGILFLDILAGLVGVIVDAATGSWYNLKPETVVVSLGKIGMIEGPEKIEVAVKGSEKGVVLNSSVAGVRINIAVMESK